MHSGVNSGVVITSDLQGDRASGPLGDMVNVAARLQSLATAGEIYIGPETRSLVGSRFVLTDFGDRELKGRREPVRVTRVDGLRAAQTRPSRRSGSFVGRQEELGVLLGAVDRLRDGETSLITVCAEAGSGKTRLLEEVRSRLGDDVQWYEGRAYPYTADIPYAPLVDLFNNAAAIDENDGVAQVRAKLTAMVTTLLPGDDLALAAIGQPTEPRLPTAPSTSKRSSRCCAARWRVCSTPWPGGRRRSCACRTCTGSTRPPQPSSASWRARSPSRS